MVLSYDSDEAGQKATERSLGLFASTNLRVKVLSIPGAKDPDEYIKKYGRDRFEALLEGTANPTEFALAKLRGQFDLKSDGGRMEYLNQRGGDPGGQPQPGGAGRLPPAAWPRRPTSARPAILNQLKTAQRTAGRKAYRRQQRELAGQASPGPSGCPYDKGGDGGAGGGVRRPAAWWPP